MHPRALVKSTFLIFLCAVGVSPAIAQQTASSEEIRSVLRIASGLLPGIDENQRSGVAYSIAGEQMRIGDLSGALDSVKVAGNEDQRAWPTSHVASVLAWQGNLPLALKLVRTSAKQDDRIKAQDYGDVAQALANRNAFEDALTVAHLMEDGPGFLGKTGLVVRTLMEIQAKQWATGDTAGAEGTLNAAMDAVQREHANPFTSEFADVMPAQIYQGMVGDLTREGNRQAALSVLERIYNNVADAGPSASKQYVLFTLTAAQANLGELQAALNTTLKMETGEKRDNALFLIALERTRQGDPSGAFDLALGLSDESWRNSSLRGVADAQAASGDYVSALSTVDQIRGAGEHAYGLSELALDRAEKNDPAAGLIAQLAWEAALNGGNETKPDVFAQIAVARGMTGDIAGALDILGRMAPNDRSWAIQSLTEILVHAGQKTEAIALAESQDQAYAKACAYLGVARQLFEEQKEAAGKRPGL